MPINPSIPLGVRPGPAPILPSQLEKQQLSLANLGRREQLDTQQMQLNQMRLTEAQQRQKEQAAAVERAGKVRAILEKHGDVEKALPEIWAVDPAAADKFETHLYDRRKRDYEMRKAELDQASSRAKRLGEIASTATDQATFRRAIGMAVSEKLLTPDQASSIGDAWDDSTKSAVNQFKMQALDVQKQLDEARKEEEQGWKKAESDRKAAAEKRAEETHQATLPGKTADPKTGLTPAQADTSRRRQEDSAERKRHNQAMEAKEDKRTNREDSEQRKSDIKEAQKIQAQIDALQKEKRTLDAERSSIGQMSKSKAWKKDEKGLRTKGEANYARVTARLEEIAKDEQELIRRKDQLYSRHSTANTADDLFKSYGK